MVTNNSKLSIPLKAIFVQVWYTLSNLISIATYRPPKKEYKSIKQTNKIRSLDNFFIYNIFIYIPNKTRDQFLLYLQPNLHVQNILLILLSSFRVLFLPSRSHYRYYRRYRSSSSFSFVGQYCYRCSY